MYAIRSYYVNKLPENVRPRFERMKEHASEKEPYIWGHNVTQRYIDIYQKSIQNRITSYNVCYTKLLRFSRLMIPQL